MYNINSGYGQLVQSVDMMPQGQLFVVGKSGLTGLDIIKERFKPFDGVPRYFSTIQDAVDATTANREDMVFVAPGHTETITAQIDMDTAGVKLIGLGSGSLRPTITGNGTIDCFDVSAANVTIENIGFGAPSTDAQTSCINVDAANCTLKNIYGIGSTTQKNIVDMITVTANADDLLIDGVEFWNSVVAVNSFLSLEGAASRVTVKNFFAFGDVATGGIIDGAKIDYLRLEDINVGVVGTTKPAITLDSNPEGVALRVFAAGTHGTLATNCALGNLMRLHQVWVTEETNGSAQSAQIPAVDSE